MSKQWPAADPHKTPKDIEVHTVFGGDKDCYRYRLEWHWGLGPALMVIQLHPPSLGAAWSTWEDLKVHRFATRWGFGSILFANVYALRAQQAMDLDKVVNPSGPDNDQHLMEMGHQAAWVLMGYGKAVSPAHRAQCLWVGRTLHTFGIPMKCLDVHPTGEPWQPHCCPDATEPKEWLPSGG